MLYLFKFTSRALRGLLAVIVCLLGSCVVACSDEPDEQGYIWDNNINIRLLSKDGQNLLTVDPELNSLINDEFRVKIEAGPHNGQEYEVLRSLVHSWTDSTYFYEWFLPDVEIPKYYLPWSVNSVGEMVKNYPVDNYAQITPIYGFSSHDKLYRDNQTYCVVSAYYSLAIGYREWNFEKSDRIFYITIEWPRGGLVWNFEHIVPAGHKGDKLILNGKELDKQKDLHDGFFIDLVVEDESLYQGRRF